MTFSVTILGCSSAKPSPSRHHSAQLINIHEQFYMVDCGEGTQYQLTRYGHSLLKINHIFLSHMHGDHTYGIFGLVSTMAMYGRTKHLTIYAPPPFVEMFENHMQWYDFKLTFPLELITVNARENALIYENRTIEVWSIPLRHRIACCGYLFREKEPQSKIHKHVIDLYGINPLEIAQLKRGECISLPDGQKLCSDYESATITSPSLGTVRTIAPLLYRPYAPRSYAYCSDTSASGRVAEIVKGTTLLYHESTYMHADKKMASATGHSTAQQAATIAAQAEVSHLLLGHYSSRYKDLDALLHEAQAVFPETTLGVDGLHLAIERDHSITVLRA